MVIKHRTLHNNVSQVCVAKPSHDRVTSFSRTSLWVLTSGAAKKNVETVLTPRRGV